tara:strand:- start:85 stop:1185 length:1101 start_codon:yes stop_codon:yes gene_type:complete
MKKIRLKNKQIDYPILIGSNIYKDIGLICKKYLEKNRVFIVCDNVVYDLYKKVLQNSFKKANVECIFIAITVSEKKKNIITVASLSSKIISHGVDRKDTIVAFGGGILGDIVGFTASIILRGLNYIQIPTTLLSQVDSSVGGKTGVNNIYGKNLLGSFYQPRLVVIDTNVLKTLPRRELLAGYAEIIKYGIIKDAKFFDWLQINGKKVIDGNTNARIYAIHKSCINKSQIVEADEKEHGARALLNLGHTFGHAIESLNNYKKDIIHGEAVSIGITIAAKLSYVEGYIDKKTYYKIENHFNDIGLQISLPKNLKKITAKKFVSEMIKDKKTVNKEITLILIEKLGKAFIHKKYSHSKLLKLFKEITS